MTGYRLQILAIAMVSLSLFGAVGNAQARKREPAKAERAFIEQTRIAAPERIGEFVLEGTRYDPAAKHAGVALRYAHMDHPQMRFDLFIYPAGDMPQSTALEAGMRDFRASFDAGVKMKYYEDMRVLETSAYEIPPTRAKKDEGATEDKIEPEKADSQTASDPEDIERKAIIARALTPKPIVGQRIELRYRMSADGYAEPIPMYSRGYLFYRQLYYFKGRISAAESTIDQQAFASLSDRAISELVPAIRISNIGGCAKNEVVLRSSDLDAAGKDKNHIMSMLMESLVGFGDKHCYDTMQKAMQWEPQDAEIVTIEYDASDWGSQ
ncbi:MAG: hypothetical protein IT473_07645 [Lysobacter sp.]|nr:hypothetical protein [Lysobacter sp.]